MLKINTQSEWIDRAKAALPAGGFGNFDPGIVISRGEGSRVWDEDGNTSTTLSARARCFWVMAIPKCLRPFWNNCPRA